MRQSHAPYLNVVAVLVLMATSACSGNGAAAAARPDGETDLSCAGLIYAASRLVDENKITDTDGFIKSNQLAGITRYGTAHAEANKLGGTEAFNLAKLEGMRLMGSLSGSGKVSDDEIAERARKCLGQ